MTRPVGRRRMAEPWPRRCKRSGHPTRPDLEFCRRELTPVSWALAPDATARRDRRSYRGCACAPNSTSVTSRPASAYDPRTRSSRGESARSRRCGFLAADSGAQPTPKVREVHRRARWRDADSSSATTRPPPRNSRQRAGASCLSRHPDPAVGRSDCVHLVPAATPLVQHTRRGRPGQVRPRSSRIDATFAVIVSARRRKRPARGLSWELRPRTP